MNIMIGKGAIIRQYLDLKNNISLKIRYVLGFLLFIFMYIQFHIAEIMSNKRFSYGQSVNKSKHAFPVTLKY